MRDSFSLVLHDDTAHSNDPALERILAAHVIYNLLTSNRFFISDSQVVGTRNLRQLLRHNTTIREMVESKLIVFLVRGEWRFHPGWENDTKNAEFYWDAIQYGFIRNEKMRTEPDFYRITHELKFIQDHATTETYEYQNISDNFSRLLRQNITSKYAVDRLGEAVFERIQELLKQEISEKPSGDSLGTTFIQEKVPTSLEAQGVLLSDDQKRFLRSAYIGPYAANLPDSKNLLPQYTDDLAEAFDIMRGSKLEWSDEEVKQIKARSLKSSLLVEGLLRMTPDDIHRVRDGHAFKKFNRLTSKGNNDPKIVDEIGLAYVSLQNDINEQIVRRLNPSATLAYDDSPLKSIFRWFKGDTANDLGGEAVSVAINQTAGALVNATVPMVGFAAQQIVGRIRKKYGVDERSRGKMDRDMVAYQIGKFEDSYEEKIAHFERLDAMGKERTISEVYLTGSEN